METVRKVHSPIPVLIAIGGIVLGLVGLFADDPTIGAVRPLFELCGGLMLLAGAAVMLWPARGWFAAHCGLVLLVIGLAGLCACLFFNFMAGIIASGFVAVIGAILFRRK